MTRQLELPLDAKGEARQPKRSGEAASATTEDERSGASGLMEQVLSRPNMLAALKRVRKNKGSPGIDGMTVDDLTEWLRAHWPRVREELLSGAYQPQPVKRQLIPKNGGGQRKLGIPTALDRLIQQALLQVLQPLFDPTFSGHSHGFRPGRSAHGAIREAQRYIQDGRRVAVDVDLKSFFDLVNHDVLMGLLAKRIADKEVLRLIRRYLRAGVMVNGVAVERYKGTPQGGPLSPLLANVLLDVVDKELEKRGHAFVRYADDCNVYVRSKRAGLRVLQLLRRQYARLKLQINEEKSAVASVFTRKFLGFTFWVGPKRRVKPKVASKALVTMKTRVRQLTRRTRGRSLRETVEGLRPYLLGWKAYFRLAETPGIFHKLDEWIRHRLRALQLKHWRQPKTIYRELRRLGMSRRGAARVAINGRRWWRNSRYLLNGALPIRFFDKLGLPKLAA